MNKEIIIQALTELKEYCESKEQCKYCIFYDNCCLLELPHYYNINKISEALNDIKEVR